MNCAGAALGDAAGILGALEVEHVAYHPQQRHFGFYVHLVHLIVDEQFHRGASGALFY
jgi:hypothetical protein